MAYIPNYASKTGTDKVPQPPVAQNANLTTRPIDSAVQSDLGDFYSGEGLTNVPGTRNLPGGSASLQKTNTGGSYSGGLASPGATTSGMQGAVVTEPGSQTPTTVESPYYTAGFLRNYIGKNMRVEFLIGTTGALVDRIGVLVEVGASYIVLRPLFSDELLMCDLYSIKFVTIYE